MADIETRFHSRNRVVTRARPRAVAGLLAVVAAGLTVNVESSAQNAPRPEALIKWRQSAFQVIAWNSARIKSALGGNYDGREVQSAANALAAVANSGLAALFAPGTADGKGWRETSVRDALFSDPQKFRSLTDEFAREASTLARLAAGTDSKAVHEQFLKVAQTCKTCHDQYRQTD